MPSTITQLLDSTVLRSRTVLAVTHCGCWVVTRLLSVLLILTTFAHAGPQITTNSPNDPPRRPASRDAADPPRRPPTAESGDPPRRPPALAKLSNTPRIDVDRLSNRPELVIDGGGFRGWVADVAISPDSKIIAACGDKSVLIIDAKTGEVLHTLRGDRGRTNYGNCNDLAFSPDGEHLVVGVHDDKSHGSIRIYRTNNFTEIEALLPGLTSSCSFVEFSRDGQYLAAVDGDGDIHIYDWPARRVVAKIPADDPAKPLIDSIQFPGREPYLMAVKYDGPHVYRVPDGKKMTPSQVPALLKGWWFDVTRPQVDWPEGTTGSPRRYEIKLEQGKWAAAAVAKVKGASRPWIGIWNAREMTLNGPDSSPVVVYRGHRWDPDTIALSENGEFAASGDRFGEIHIWNAKTGTQQHVISSQGKPVYEARFSTTDSEIVYGTTPDYKNWDLNQFGVVTNVLNLKQRSITSKPVNDIKTVPEKTSIGGATVRVETPTGTSQNFHVILNNQGRSTKYRLTSGRNPTAYTLLEQPSLSVDVPVLFSDNNGLLAMWDSATDEVQREYRGHISMVTSISPSTNGKIFLSGSTDRTIRIWSLKDFNPTGIFDFKYENAAVIKVFPDTDSSRNGVKVGDRVVSIDGYTLSDMYKMLLYNCFNYKPGQSVPVVMRRGGREFGFSMQLAEGFDNAEPLLNIFLGDHEQWIMWTPKGYYDCSPGADQLIGWHVNQGPEKAAKFFRVQQFRRQLYRPDIINRIIETGAIAEAESLAQKSRPNSRSLIDLEDPSSFREHEPPRVTILSPREGEVFGDMRVTIEAKIETQNDLPITKVTLLQNGNPAKVFRPGTASGNKEMKVSHRMRLVGGRNEISFIAANTSATSAAEDARVFLTAPATGQKSKVYVLSIGVAEYANDGHGVDNLKFAADDAKAFSEAVQKHQNGKLYTTIETNVLLNEKATRNEILKGLDWLIENVTQDDVAVLFFSGHGFLDRQDQFYLGCHDVMPAELRPSGVSWREVIEVLHEGLPACRRLVFLDACHAEGLGTALSRDPLQDLSAPEVGVIFYASCTLQQKSLESDEWQHGAFTKSLLDILGEDKFDLSGNGLANTLEIENGVKSKVSTLTRQQQQPQVFSPYRLRDWDLLEFSNTKNN